MGVKVSCDVGVQDPPPAYSLGFPRKAGDTASPLHQDTALPARAGHRLLRLSVLLLFTRSVGSNSLRPHDCSPSGFSVPGILQARILQWVAVPSCRGSSRPRGSNPGLLEHQLMDFLPLSHLGSPIALHPFIESVK